MNESKGVITSMNLYETSKNYSYELSVQFLKDDLRASLAEQNIITYTQAIEELRKEEVIYNKKEEEAYQAMKSYLNKL